MAVFRVERNTGYTVMSSRHLCNKELSLGSYNTSVGKVWIITEWDRSSTTFLFPDEY